MHESTISTVAGLRTLVAFDTVSHRSNLPAVHWLAERFESAGARLRLTYDDAGGKANLLAIFGPEREGGLVLSGHTDVVPVDGQDWDTDPFDLVAREDRLIGRGAVDMKGFVAACVAAAPRWRSTTLHVPIMVALTYDEEVGCLGVPRLLADMQAHCPSPALAVIGEPTEMRVGLSHRGFRGFHTRIDGHAAHSGEPWRGASAIAAAAGLITYVLALAPSLPAGDDETTTHNFGRIQGGTGINVVPARCDLTWECRPGTPEAEADFVAAVEAWRPPEGIRLRSESLLRVPPLRCETDSIAPTLARRWGATDPPLSMPFGTEAGFYAEVGIPTVVCGPGSIHQAHQPNEWIDTTQLEAADAFLRRAELWASRDE